MVETDKINGLEPYKYLTELFEKLPTDNTPEALAKLLPYCSGRQTAMLQGVVVVKLTLEYVK